MEITGKMIRTVAIAHLLAGLVACSSSPAPWTQSDDSPWSSKHDDAQNSVPGEQVVADTTLNDPVLLSEPEPVAMEQPEAAPAPEVIIEPVVEEMTPEQEVMAMPSTSYAVQVYASKTVASMDRFRTDKGLSELTTVKTNRNGNIVYVLVDLHPDRASARQAAGYLEEKIGTKPWVRSVAGLQKITVAE